jgi:hypothetical protein
MSLERSLSLMLTSHICLCIFHLHRASYIYFPALFPLLDQSNNILLRIQIIKLFIMNFTSFTSHCIPLSVQLLLSGPLETVFWNVQ